MNNYLKNIKFIKVIVLLLIVSVLFSCEEMNDEKVLLDDGYTLNWNISYMPRLFYPSLNLSDTEKHIVNNLYEGLMRVDNGELSYGMAESVDISLDRLEYVFKIRNAQWSDGVIVKADDFIYSWERQNNYWQEQNLLYYDTFIDHVEVEDDRYLKIVLRHPNENLLYELSTVGFMPVRRDVIDLDKRMPIFLSDVTNGPYTLKSAFMFSKISLTKNVHYYDYFDVNIDEIRIVLNNDYREVYLKYLKNEIDIVQSVSNDVLDNLLQNENNFRLFKKNGIYNFTINGERDALKQKEVRQILNLGLDRSEINPYNRIINDTVAISIFDEKIKDEIRKDNNVEFELMRDLYTFNVTRDFAEKDKVDKLMKNIEESTLEKLNEMTIITLNTPNDIEVANLVKEIWAENLGIDVVVESKDRYDYTYALRTNSYDIIINNYYFVEIDPRHMLKYFLSDTRINRSEFETELFDTKMVKTFSYSDASLHKLYENLMDEIDDLAVNIPLFKIYEPAIINPEIVNWSRSYESLFYFGRASKIKNGSSSEERD